MLVNYYLFNDSYCSVLCCSFLIFQICHQGHSVWRWNSQPTLKYGMHAGDFMLSSNILLSGNNYGKVALLFKFMNLGIVHRTTFFKIQDAYCVDAIEDYWDDKRSAIITRLKSKDSVVALGKFANPSPTNITPAVLHTADYNVAQLHLIYLLFV